MIDFLMGYWQINAPATVATVCLIGYFTAMGIMFIPFPIENAKMFSVQPIDQAGKTEIRVYYGGISWALAIFLAFLALSLGTPYYSMIGGMIFATSVLTIRTIFTFVDKGWSCAYTKLAIPAESAFVIALWTCFFISKSMYGDLAGAIPA